MFINLHCRLCCLRNPTEVADVLARLFDDPGIVVAVRALVSGDDRTWPKRLDRVESRNPLASGLSIRFGKVEVNVVVGGIPRDD